MKILLALCVLLVSCNSNSIEEKIAPFSIPMGTSTGLNVVDEYGDHVPIISNGFSPKQTITYYTIRVYNGLGYIAELNPTESLVTCRTNLLYMDQDETFYFCTEGIGTDIEDPWNHPSYNGFSNLSDFGQVTRARIFDEGGIRVADFVDDGRLYW